MPAGPVLPNSSGERTPSLGQRHGGKTPAGRGSSRAGTGAIAGPRSPRRALPQPSAARCWGAGPGARRSGPPRCAGKCPFPRGRARPPALAPAPSPGRGGGRGGRRGAVHPCPSPAPLRVWLVPPGPGARPGRGRPGKAAARAARSRTMEGHLARCKIVVVGDTQCGKTALLHVFAKDCYPESYVPTVFENYTASFEIDKQRTELNMWDTSGSAYYDNVRPLAYPDSDAVLICFDISRPETLDSVLKKWQGETQEFCPNAKIVLVGCKLDMRTDLNTLRELSKQRLIPVTHEQGSALARQIGAVAYAECSSKVSENSVRDVFHVTTLASVNRVHKNLKRSNSKRGLKRASQMPGRTDLLSDTEIRKDRAKSCSIM
uniref:Rho family GTPase 2 n=15 Tax=Neoaves TaxID=3078114 RepID=A0A8B9GHT1_9PSIT